jgi:hypothetical protein
MRTEEDLMCRAGESVGGKPQLSMYRRSTYQLKAKKPRHNMWKRTCRNDRDNAIRKEWVLGSLLREKPL